MNVDGDPGVSVPVGEAESTRDPRLAPPRSNGELTFQAPWESQAFAMAVCLQESEVVGSETFRNELARAIKDWEQFRATPWSYYECWLTALEEVALRHELVVAEDLRQRAAELAHRDDHAH